MMQRRVVTVFGAMVMAILLTTTSALAHQCYNASRSDTGNAHAENGMALVSYTELIELFLCPEGATIVASAVDAHGFDTEGILVNSQALMGSGAHHRGLKTTDGHDIDYLPDWFLDALIAAFGTCFGGPPA